MAELTPNTPPPGENCGACRYAGTHTHAPGEARTLVRCLRYPPQRRGFVAASHSLKQQNADTLWPVLTWDDWCGEWAPRLPDREATEAPASAAPTVDQIMDLVYEYVAHDGHGSCTYRDLRAPLEAAMAPAEVTGGKNSADYDRRQMEAKINAILKRQTAHGAVLTTSEIRGVVQRIAPGWEYAFGPLANPPEVYLTIYSPSAPQ